MTPDEFCDLALSFPLAHQSGHFDVTDFRVGKKIFATFRPADGRAVLKLSPDAQPWLMSTSPGIFAPVQGAWGQKSWTLVHLGPADAATVRHAMTFAWKSIAPKKLLAASGLT